MTNVLNCIETSINNEKNILSSFLIEPLETGQGITLGNSLRRTLLSDITGFAITGVRINNLKHEFSIIEGIREDVLEILLNLKDIVFQPTFLLNDEIDNINKVVSIKNNPLKFKTFLNVKGPLIVTAGMLFLPKKAFKILNPEQYICTLVDDSNLYLEMDIENGIGYQLTEEIRKKNPVDRISLLEPTTLLVDSVFMPIKRVNFKVKLIHDSFGNIKESLLLEILTNGSITPKRSLHEAIKILINLFYPLLLTPELIKITEKFSELNESVWNLSFSEKTIQN